MSKKISGLPVASTLDGSEKVELTQGGQSVSSTTQDIANLATTTVTDNITLGVDTFTFLIDDFFGDPTNLYLSRSTGIDGSISSSSFGVDTTEKCIGVLALSTDSGAAGTASIFSDATQIAVGLGFQIYLKFRSALNALGDVTNNYSAIIGFGDASGPDQTDGMYFRYNYNVNGGRWQAVTANNGTRTSTDTGVSAAITTYNIFEITCNEAGNSVEFKINGVVVATNATSIPTATRFFGVLTGIWKTAGTSARTLYHDYFNMTLTRTTSR